MLKQILLKQLEYYFSRRNLATDSFLVSQMNAELFVPVAVVAQFAKIQALTTDEALLLDVMKSSPHLIVDDTQRRVRPNFQIQRNTLILRDIPSDADPSASRVSFHYCSHCSHLDHTAFCFLCSCSCSCSCLDCLVFFPMNVFRLSSNCSKVHHYRPFEPSSQKSAIPGLPLLTQRQRLLKCSITFEAKSSTAKQLAVV